MESRSNCSHIFSQASSDTPCNCDAHSEPEMKVSARSSPARRKKRLSSEAAPCLGDLTLAGEGTNRGSQPLFHHQPSPLGALHDHALYCIPEEAAALKNLVRKLKDTVSRQSELVFSLQKTVEDQELQYQELQKKAEGKKCHVLTDLEAHISQLEARNPNLCCQQYQLEPQGPRLQKDANSATVFSLSDQARRQLEGRAQHDVFSLEGMKTNSKWLKFYTGFDGYPRLRAFLDFLQEGEGLENGPPYVLSPGNQLFLVLVRLRLGLLLQDLAFRFRISESTACRYWLSWIELMERKLRQVPVAFNQRYIDAFKPQQQLQHHDMVLVALDCAELFFETQGRTRGKRGGFRSPRAHYSIHGSALAAPSGFLTFSAGTGRHELPTLPPFLQAGPVELTAQQEAAKRQVLSLRSLTDKALRFRFLRLVHPQNMEDQVRRAWIISCYLACLLHEPMGLT